MSPCLPQPQAERSDGPDRGVPCDPAEERSAMGCARAPCASLTDSSCLFELSERSERCELHDAAHGASTAGCPERSGGTGAPGSPSFAYFSWAIAKKSESSCGGEIPASGDGSAGGVHRTHHFKTSTRGRDMRPAAQSLSFVSPKESNQRKGDPGAHDPALRSGQPAGLAAWGPCTTRTGHCVHSARTSAMSQSTKRKVPLRRPGHCAPRRGHRGPKSTRAIASLGCGVQT